MRQLIALVAASSSTACYAPTPPPGAPCSDGECPTGLVCSPATNTCERAATPDALADAPLDPGADAQLSAFKYRRQITIQNTSGTALAAGFTIRVPLGTLVSTLVQQGKLEADHSDLRVIEETSLGERNRVVDTAPAPSAVSFSLAQPIGPGATSTAYWLYYGNPGAGSPPQNGGAVFAVYDDFTSSIATFWQQNDGPVASGGQLVLRAGHTDALATVAASDGVPVVSAVELVATVANPDSDPTPQPTGTFYYWFGYQRSGDFTATDPWILWIARGKGALRAEQKSPVGCETECASTTAVQNTAARYYVIERDPSVTRFYLDGTLSFTATVTNSTDYSVMLRNFMATSDLRVDWVRARARVTPEPTITLGPEAAL